MFDRRMRWAVATFVVVGALAQDAEAQLNRVTVTPHSGVAVPVGRLADYTALGFSMGLQAEYPLAADFDLLVRAERDALNGNVPGIPDLTLRRYQAGIERDVFGDTRQRWGLRGSVALGLTDVRTPEFFVRGASTPSKFEQSYFTGAAGLAVVFGASSDIHGYLGGRLTWTPMKESDTALLRNAAMTAPDPLKSALSVPVTLGLRIRTS